MIILPGEFGKERGPPFLEGGELSPELFQLAVSSRLTCASSVRAFRSRR
jgi:hypothetical protein